MNWKNPIRKLYKIYKILENKVQSHPITHRTEQEKREYISYWAERVGYETFVETGTYLGQTATYMSSVFKKCHTIELSKDFYDAAEETLGRHENVSRHHGDSADVLPAVLDQVDGPAIFWLDAHYSAGVTAGNKRRTPILPELEAIFAHRIEDHVILIDDAREFLGMKGYPTIRELRRFVRSGGDGYKMIINNDIIVIYHEGI